MTDLRIVLGGGLNYLIAVVAGGFLGRLIPWAKTEGSVVGAQVGGVVVNAINSEVDPALRSIVISEFKSIVADVTLRSQTVLETSTTLLQKVIPEVPSATVSQVAQILSEFVLTFEAGLATAFNTEVQGMAILEAPPANKPALSDSPNPRPQ